MKTYVNNFLKYKSLFIELIIRDIKIKYKNSYIGILWSMLNPLLMMVVLTIIFSQIFERHIENFPVYVLTGRLIYTFFSDSTNQALDSIHANSQLIRKVYVPKYFFPISRICSSFVINTVSLIPIFIVMLFTGMSFSVYNFLIVVPIILLFLICLGAGLALSAITVFFRDLKHLYSVILTILMYTTPIFYPYSIIPQKYMYLMEANPLFSILKMLRDVLMYNMLPNINDVLISSCFALIFLIIGLVLFQKKQDRFIYHI